MPYRPMPPSRMQGFVRAAALACALLAASLPALAVDWTYRVRPGDNLWDLATRYLRSDIAWQRLQQHNGVRDPYALPPGTSIRIPVQWLREQPESARVAFVRGAVTSSAGEGVPETAATQGQRIGIGGWIATGDNASATVEFADGSRVMLSPGTRVAFDRLARYGRTGMVDTRMRVQQGRATHRVETQRGPASHYDVGAPSATSSVRGTRFRTSVQDGRETTEVLEGRVAVDGTRGDADLKAGFGSRNDGGVRARALLPAPMLDEAATRTDALPVSLAWVPLEGASAYLVDVVDADAHEIQRAEMTVPSPSARIDALPAGRYLMRVRAIDVEGVAGRDAVRAIDIPAGPAPPLTLRPTDGEVVFQRKPRFEWARSEGAVRAHVQIARDAAMNDRVAALRSDDLRTRAADPLQPGSYWWRVAAEDADGQVGLFGEALPFEIAEPPADAGLSTPASDDGRLVIRWRAFRDAPRYRVELSRDAAFDDVRLNETVSVPELRVARPGGGRWFVRVHAFDQAGDEVQIGGVQEIRLPCRACYIAGGAGAALLLLLL
ncbi:FecR family protein [Lysobacter arvi]|uniref:FecR domain-containing protein n=1 Tax=Lysobacter arvi TaxID=3038776 RepID=A0ABU1CA42_9GAMM|nr:FecR domain-containing protein [Lysobacter arvi]MDR0182054.1 FecR domain-containing protein [Lysobacter arvi]